MNEECGSFVGETQDRTYAPGNNRNDPGDNQLTGLEQHNQRWIPTHAHCCTAADWAKPVFFICADVSVTAT